MTNKDKNNQDEEIEVEIKEAPSKEEIIKSRPIEIESEIEELVQETRPSFFRPPSLQAIEPSQQEATIPLEVQMQNVPKPVQEEETETDLSKDYDSGKSNYELGGGYEGVSDASGYPEQIRARDPSLISNIQQQPQFAGGYPEKGAEKQYESSADQEKAQQEKRKKMF